MARSVNKVILVGNLGKDPEVRHLESGAAVANFPIATSESYKDRNSGELITNTDWHNIVLWRGLAEIAEKYLKKGDKVYIEGKIRNRSYQDQEGITKYITEIVGDNLVMMGKPETGAAGNHEGNSASGANPKVNEFTGESDDDDLPF
ncbi:single-stranded DNA-binding protein [Parvicella tangerina]|uniref:Single-stranded DNA-binding protein n=1 Tax=Parvicella tangerina TaxID=2829795 RepID=A0A916NSM8_9FLAO|nr:single-stranded DNA-binding protein [Parvicella tangerina]CAG5084105.1 Single-stranded DNA-binding protein [Parvicella tangerina]